MVERTGKPMTELAFWKQKIVQLLHDPVAKPYASYPGGPGCGGHQAVALKHLEVITDVGFKAIYNKSPDLAMSGADRPMIHTPREKKPQIQVHWPDNPIVTHPLQAAELAVKPGREITRKIAGEEKTDLIQALNQLMDEIAKEKKEDKEGEKSDRDPAMSETATWGDTDILRHRHLLLWRRLQADLIQPQRADDLSDQEQISRRLWQLMPADSRSPDHTIWDHNRLTSALAFMGTSQDNANARAPWFFRFELGPVGRFIAESTTSRDLWMSSFLLSELTWQAMQPIIEHYGPDCVLYPDLRANPRADLWLAKRQYLLEAEGQYLPEGEENPRTYAAVLPNTFTALLPLGGEGMDYLRPLEELAKEAQRAVEIRWQELADIVKQWLVRQRGSGGWETIFKRHAEISPFATTWVAVHWARRQSIDDPDALFGPALPGQCYQPPSEKDQKAVKECEDRLRHWVDTASWGRYTEARRVFLHSNKTLSEYERGHDYALIHHQLRLRHALRKQENAEPPLGDETGEKCTQCGRRQALYNQDDSGGHNRNARNFWHPSWDHRWGKDNRLNPGEETERLCGVCAIKRFLVEAGSNGQSLTGVNPIWAGHQATVAEIADSDGRVRIPFPATATVAAVYYLRGIGARLKEGGARAVELQAKVNDVVHAYKMAELPRTGFARALGALAEFNQVPEVRAFLMLDTQNALFPNTLEVLIRRAEGTTRTNLQNLMKAVQALRQFTANEKHGIDPPTPETRFAVLRLDGDHMGRLLLGDKNQVQSRWRDILHPDALEQVQKHEHLKQAGWMDLLEQPRLMGPSLHAVISRMLAQFSHRIVPWVVEREFAGRLIYAGGDDVLALAPAAEALDISARLRELFSTPWVIDTRPGASAWDYRHGEIPDGHDPERDKKRFVIPEVSSGKVEIDWEQFKQPYDVLPLLGAGVTLSAGIAYGHFKTSLGSLLHQTKILLEQRAKREAKRNAVAMSLHSRNGAKIEGVMKWCDNEGKAADYRMKQVVDGFRNNVLAARLPYKLQAFAPTLKGLGGKTDEESRAILLWGLFKSALDSTTLTTREGRSTAKAAFALWQEGLRHRADIEQATGLLLLARKLSQREEER